MATNNNNNAEELKAVVVTTEHKGVYFGYIPKDAETTSEQLTLTQARCCVYWSYDVHGWLGLAAKGPDKQSRVGPAVPALTLFGVTAVVDCSEGAAKNWEAEKWA
jgi:hypothetical protein